MMAQQHLDAGVIGDLDHAERLIEEWSAANRDGNVAGAAIAQVQLSITIDWVRDRLGHAAGLPCHFQPHIEYCPMVWGGEGGAA